METEDGFNTCKLTALHINHITTNVAGFIAGIRNYAAPKGPSPVNPPFTKFLVPQPNPATWKPASYRDIYAREAESR